VGSGAPGVLRQQSLTGFQGGSTMISCCSTHPSAGSVSCSARSYPVRKKNGSSAELVRLHGGLGPGGHQSLPTLQEIAGNAQLAAQLGKRQLTTYNAVDLLTLELRRKHTTSSRSVSL